MDECQRLTRAIDAYIAKADDDLADVLTDEGYADATETVNRAARIEAEVAEALDDELNAILTAAERSVDLKEFADSVWQGVKLNDTLAEKLFIVFQEQLSEFMPELVSTYLTQTDKQLTLTSLSRRTTAWVDEWSEELGGLMKLTTQNEIQTILKSGLESGASLQTFTNAILDSGIRDTRYRARRVAITEVLRAHSVAREERIQQSPAVTQKEWVHTGSYRNEPRPNHVAISGTVVPKDEAFTLIGADGATYYPQYPRDTNLPAGESVNCHCIHRGMAK
ncbi:hypothetical protein FACS1894217_03860 [Clostridia bacterium]|nr:hypothetical protein FACS1894217_03860 [Clostridia bacterium]